MPTPAIRDPLAQRRVIAEGLPVQVLMGTAGDVDVVLLHGIPGSARSWDAMVACLPAGVRPVVPDLLGFGGSGRPTAIDDLHAEGQARRMEEVLDQLAVRRPVLVGHDFGGPVALRMIMRQPGRYAGLVLAATNAFGDTPVPFPLSLVKTPLVGDCAAQALFSRPALRAMCRFGARQGQVDTDAAVGDRRQAAAIAAIFGASLRRLGELYLPIERALPDFALPTLVLWGDRDPFFSVAQGERLASAIQGARLQVLEGCGHFLPEEAPERFASLIAEVARTGVLV